MNPKELPSTTPHLTCGMLCACGLAAWLNAALVPFLHMACELNNTEAFGVLAAFYLALAAGLMALTKTLRSLGYRQTTLVGLMALAAGVMVFIPASLMRSYPLFLLGLAVMGLGVAMLRTPINSYTLLFENSLFYRLLPLCGKACGAIGVLALGGILFHHIGSLESSIAIAEGASRDAELDILARKLTLPYLALLALLLGLLAAVAKYLPHLDLNRAQPKTSSGAPCSVSRRHVAMSMLALFVSLGVEVVCVCSSSSYGKTLGMSLAEANVVPVLMLMLAAVCGVCGKTFFEKRMANSSVHVSIFAAASLVVATVAVSVDGLLSLAMLMLLALPNALLLPAVLGMFSRACSSAKVAVPTSTLLGLCIIGAALLPLAFGVMADAVNYRYAYTLLLPCYAVILLMAMALKRLPALP
jgi:fucose permease